MMQLPCDHAFVATTKPNAAAGQDRAGFADQKRAEGLVCWGWLLCGWSMVTGELARLRASWRGGPGMIW